MMWIKRISTILLACIGFFNATFCQSFSQKTELDSIPKTGFYTISLSSEMSRFTMPDLRDLRIVDEKGNTVPYIVRSTGSAFDSMNYQPFKIVSNQLSDSGNSLVDIENPQSKKISDFSLQIKNAVVSRTASLSGSNDLVNWYSIRENINLSFGQFTNKDNFFEDIQFPPSTYRYIRLAIDNGKNDPLNIISAGRFSKTAITQIADYAENPGFPWTQKDSTDHFTYIFIANPEQYQVGYVKLNLAGPRYFKRHVEILHSGASPGDFTITSDSVFTLNFPVFKDSLWTIRVENGDNPPLIVKSVSSGLELRKLIAYLVAGIHYKIMMNDPRAALPEYDLQNFKDSIPKEITEIKISGIEHVAKKTVIPGRVFFKQGLIWPVIIVVILLLGYFTFKLSKEVNEKNK